ncbi:MAG: hypothetical protein GQ564_12955 [Bacteroidales bacterium]|nr:hypothetical protein [Bacteroidales bacterium]
MNLNKIFSDKDDLSHIILFIGLLIFIIVVSLIYKNRNKRLEENFGYTIGVTQEIKRPYNSNDYILYEIKVNEKSYSGSLLDMINVLVPKGKYIVKYDFSNPNNNKMLKEYKVKDTVFEIPNSGWTQLPMEIIDK